MLDTASKASQLPHLGAVRQPQRVLRQPHTQCWASAARLAGAAKHGAGLSAPPTSPVYLLPVAEPGSSAAVQGGSTANLWLENSAEADVAAPVERCYAMWEDRERIPQWMPWIRTVKVVPEDPRLSRWTLATRQLNQDFEFNWLAQNLAPTRYQKIHWRSVQGSTGGSFVGGVDVANRGQIRFYRKGPAACAVKLTISYEVPDALAPLAGTLRPIVENILRTDLGRFAALAAAQQGAPAAAAK